MLPFAPRPFLLSSRRRPVKASLRPQVRRDVQAIIALAPVIGDQVPEEAAAVIGFMRALLPEASPVDGWESAPPEPPPLAGGLDLPHFLLSPELNVFMVSDALRAMLHMDQREFRRHWREHLEAADTATLQVAFEQAMATHEGFSERVHWQTGDGVLGSWLRLTPRRFHDGAFAGFTAVIVFDQAAVA